MKRIEKLYNKYFNNVIDKVALGIVLTYGISVILLGIMLVTGNDTFFRAVVNRFAESIKVYVIWFLGIIPTIRYYQIIFKESILEDIAPKNYKKRFLEMYKVYIGMFLMAMTILFIHALLLPIINSKSDNIGVTILLFVKSNISGVSMIASSVLLGIYAIVFSVFMNVNKSKSVLKVVIVMGIYILYGKVYGLLPDLFNTEIGNGYMLNYIYKYLVSIIVNLSLSVIFMRYILNNINKIDVKKINI